MGNYERYVARYLSRGNVEEVVAAVNASTKIQVAGVIPLFHCYFHDLITEEKYAVWRSEIVEETYRELEDYFREYPNTRIDYMVMHELCNAIFFFPDMQLYLTPWKQHHSSPVIKDTKNKLINLRYVINIGLKRILATYIKLVNQNNHYYDKQFCLNSILDYLKKRGFHTLIARLDLVLHIAIDRKLTTYSEKGDEVIYYGKRTTLALQRRISNHALQETILTTYSTITSLLFGFTLFINNHMHFFTETFPMCYSGTIQYPMIQSLPTMRYTSTFLQKVQTPEGLIYELVMEIKLIGEFDDKTIAQATIEAAVIAYKRCVPFHKYTVYFYRDEGKFQKIFDITFPAKDIQKILDNDAEYTRVLQCCFKIRGFYCPSDELFFTESTEDSCPYAMPRCIDPTDAHEIVKTARSFTKLGRRFI